MSLPSSTKAIVIKAKGVAAVEDVPVPKLRDDNMIVKVNAVGLNPSDVHAIDYSSGGDPRGARSGCDYAGVVIAVGSKVTKDFKKGDRVCGIAHGANRDYHEDGGWAEYITVKGDLQIKTPANLKDEDAATLGIGVTTVAQGLYQTLKLPLPTSPASTPFPILIYGGSTATGILGIQFAKLSGLTVITTSSPRNFDYMRSLGADFVFDYHSPTCVADIRAAAGEKLTYAWDCITSPTTARLCAESIAPEGGNYAALRTVPEDVIKAVNPKINTGRTLAYTVFGETFSRGDVWPASKEDYEFGKMFWELSRELLESEKVKPARTVLNQGGKGLEGVLKGVEEMRAGRVSGAKMVYTMS